MKRRIFLQSETRFSKPTDTNLKEGSMSTFEAKEKVEFYVTECVGVIPNSGYRCQHSEAN